MTALAAPAPPLLPAGGASFSSGETGGPAAPALSCDPHGAGGPHLRGPHTPARAADIPASWIPLTDLHAAPIPAANDNARRVQLQRCAVALAAAGGAVKRGKAWWVAPTVPIAGKPARYWRDLAQGLAAPELAGRTLPPGYDQWGERDRRRYLATVTLVDAWDAFCARWAGPRDEATLEAAFSAAPLAEYVRGAPAQSAAQFCREQGLKCTPRRLRDYRTRLPLDGNVDRRGCNGGEPVVATPAAWDMFRALYLTPQRRTVKLCWEIVNLQAARDKWTWPDLRRIQERVARELPPALADKHRLGPLAWERKYGPRIVRDLSAVRPGACWIGDHCKFDFLCLDKTGKPIRAWLTAWLDQRSRKLVGWRVVKSPDSDSILGAFADGVRTYGAPQHLIIDNGKDYRAQAFSGGRRQRRGGVLDPEYVRSVCGRMHIDVTFCEPFNPGSKAIESFFGTMHERFDRLFDSYCGRDPQERPEDLYLRLVQRRVDVPTLDEVVARFATYLETDYHRQPHSGDGMHGLSPNDVFANCDPIPRRTAPEGWLALLLAKLVPVKVTRNGVRYRDVNYGQGEPQLVPALVGQQVFLRIDPARADCVEVCDEDGRAICWAFQQRLDGLNHDDIKEARRRRKAARRVADAALSGAYRDARKSVVELAQDLRADDADTTDRLRAAAGAEGLPPPRGLQLLATDATTAPVPYLAPASGEPAALDWGDGDDTEDVPTTDLLGQLDFSA